MITTRLWEILVAFYQCGTLCAAAEKLYVSQPSLSSAVKQLEQELGVTLFERTKNRIVLNEIGIEAAKLAENHLNQEEYIIHHLQEMQRRLRTITVASYVSNLRKELTSKLSNMFPDRNIASEHIPSENLLLGLIEGRFDFVITEYKIDEPDLVCVPYVTDRLMVRVHSSDELASRKHLTIADLKGSKLLIWVNSGFWANFLRKEFSDSLHLIFVNDEQEYWDLVSSFTMRSFILETVLDKRPSSPEYRCIPLKEDGNLVTFYLCCAQKNAHLLPKLKYQWHSTMTHIEEKD